MVGQHQVGAIYVGNEVPRNYTVLPTEGELTLSLYCYLAYGVNSSPDDYLQVKVVGSTTATVFEELGAAENDDVARALENVSLNAFAGQTVYLLVEAADAGPASLLGLGSYEADGTDTRRLCQPMLAPGGI